MNFKRENVIFADDLKLETKHLSTHREPRIENICVFSPVRVFIAWLAENSLMSLELQCIIEEL